MKNWYDVKLVSEELDITTFCSPFDFLATGPNFIILKSKIFQFSNNVSSKKTDSDYNLAVTDLVDL